MSQTVPLSFMKQNGVKIEYFRYVRKSEDDDQRQVLSINSQNDWGTEIEKKEGLRIKANFEEERTAKEPGRPVFNDMLRRIQRGEARGILTWKLDRLSRNPIDDGQIRWMLQRGIIQHIRTVERDYYPGDNIVMMSVEFAMANQYIRDLAVNVKRGMEHKAKQGWYPAKAPLGYLNESWKPQGEGTIIKDEDRFRLLRRAIELFLSGAHTASQVYEIATNEWDLRMRSGKPLSRSAFYAFLGDLFYCGLFEWPKGSGNWYRGAHPIMLTEDEYDQVQILLGRKGRPCPKHHVFAFTGTMQCGECGAAITAAKKVKRQKNGNIHRYTYYFCTKRKNPKCSQRCIEEKVLTAQIIEVLDRLSAPRQFYEYARKWFRGDYDTEAELHKKILARHQGAYKACLEKLDKLIDMRAAEEISEEEFARKRGKLLKEKVRFQGLLKEAGIRADGWVDVAQDMITFIEGAKERLRNGTPEQRREILVTLGWNRTLTDQKLAMQLQKPLIPMEKVVFAFWRIFLGLEPRQKGMTEREFERLYDRSPVLCPLLDEVRTAVFLLASERPSYFAFVRSW